jgi:hypothetical protein
MQTVYYRLKLIDLDGTFAYSDVRVLTGKDLRGDANIFPNPFEHQVTVLVESTTQTQATVELFDITGKKVAVSQFTALPGTNHFTMNELGGLEPGVYFVKVSSVDSVHTSRVVKQ